MSHHCNCWPPCSFVPTAKCDCGEELEACSTFTSAQHSNECAVMKEYVTVYRAQHGKDPQTWAPELPVNGTVLERLAGSRQKVLTFPLNPNLIHRK